MPLTDSLAVEQIGSVTLVRLSRPHKRNALDDETVAGLGELFRSLPKATRAVVLHGEGPHFCAGLDLSVISDMDATEGIAHSQRWHHAFAAIESGAVPVIAALHGAAIGGGLELAMACHIRVADHTAYYALPEGQRGIFVGGGAAVRLPRLIGLARMQDMMLTGRVYGAIEGERVGFSQYVVEPGAALEKAMELAQRAAANAALTTFAVLHALPRIAEADPRIGGLMESLMAGIASGDKDAKGKLQDFLEGRAEKITRD